MEFPKFACFLGRSHLHCCTPQVATAMREVAGADGKNAWIFPRVKKVPISELTSNGGFRKCGIFKSSNTCHVEWGSQWFFFWMMTDPQRLGGLAGVTDVGCGWGAFWVGKMWWNWWAPWGLEGFPTFCNSYWDHHGVRNPGKRVEPSKLVEDVRGWLFRAPPRSPSTATGGDTTGTWVGRTPRRSTAAARIKWLVKGVGLGRSCLLRNWVELGGGSKYRLFCLFCTSTYLNVFEMSYTSVQYVYIYNYIYIYMSYMYIYIYVYIIYVYI